MGFLVKSVTRFVYLDWSGEEGVLNNGKRF